MNKTIFCIIGKSASGKDTIFKNILSNIYDIHPLIPITTRPQRVNEYNGIDYLFYTKEQFFNHVNNKSIMEYRSYDVKTRDGMDDIWYYGHTYPKNDFSIMIGTLDILDSLKTSEDIKIYPIYIDVDDSERLYRLITRENKSNNPNYRELARRFVADNVDFSDDNLHKHNITDENTFTNDKLNITVESISNYIKNIIDNERKNKND